MTTISSADDDDDTTSFDATYKVLLIGDADSGVQSLFKVIEDESIFVSEACDDVKVKYFDILDKKIKFEMWNTCKATNSRRILDSYFVNARGALLVYNDANRSAFINIRMWHNHVIHKSDARIKLVLVGHSHANNSIEEDVVVVSKQEGKELADELGMPFCTVREGNTQDIEGAFYSLYKIMGSEMNSELGSVFSFCSIS